MSAGARLCASQRVQSRYALRGSLGSPRSSVLLPVWRLCFLEKARVCVCGFLQDRDVMLQLRHIKHFLGWHLLLERIVGCFCSSDAWYFHHLELAINIYLSPSGSIFLICQYAWSKLSAFCVLGIYKGEMWRLLSWNPNFFYKSAGGVWKCRPMEQACRYTVSVIYMLVVKFLKYFLHLDTETVFRVKTQFIINIFCRDEWFCLLGLYLKAAQWNHLGVIQLCQYTTAQ